MKTIKQLAEDNKRKDRDYTEGVYGEIGLLNSDGSYTVFVSGTQDVWVRIDGNPSNTVAAINQKVLPKARLPVRMRMNKSRRYEIIDPEPIRNEEFMGEAAGTANLPPLVGSAVPVVWESDQFKPGRVRSLDGTDLNVFMEELPYGDTLLGNVSLDLSTVVGAITSGKKALIVVSVDPTTNTLTATSGGDVGLPVQLTRAMALAVAVPTGDIRLRAYIISEGATALPRVRLSADTDFQFDLRPWITLPGAGSGAPTNAHYVTTEAEAGLSNEFNLGGLTTGLLKHTVSGSVSTPATATPGTDYLDPTNANITNYIDVTEASTPSTPASDHARTWFADDNGFTVERFIDSGGKIFNTDQMLYVIAKNTSGSTIGAGNAISLINISGGMLLAVKASATASLTNTADGVSLDSAANNGFMRVVIFGIMDADTSGYSTGALYQSVSSAGALQNAAPTQGTGWGVVVGSALDSSASGHIFVNIRVDLVRTYINIVPVGGASSAALKFFYPGGNSILIQPGSSPAANRIQSLLDADGTFVLDAATQTLTNKTLTSPTITTPTIASFTNATHNHQNTAGGGTLDGASIAAGTVAAARLGTMTGASSGAAGASGAAPQPAAGDDVRLLSGAATYLAATLRQFSQTADVSIASSTAETTLIGAGQGTVTLAANQLRVGTAIRITATGYGQRTGGNYTFRVKLGGTTIIATATSAAAWAANGMFRLDALITCRTTGATGTVQGQGVVMVGTTVVDGQPMQLVATGTSTIDTTGTLAIDVTGQFSASAATNTVTVTNLLIEVSG